MNRVGNVPDAQQALDELAQALEDYWRKWELVRKENAECWVRVDLALKKVSPSSVEISIAGSDTGTSNDPFIRFNPPIDANPALLKREANMLEVLNFIESVTYYIRSGFKFNSLGECMLGAMFKMWEMRT